MDAALQPIPVLLSLSQRFETAANRFFERKDLTIDNIAQLRRLQRRFTEVQQLLPKLKTLVSHDVVTTSRLHDFQITLQEDFEAMLLLQKHIRDAKPTHRVRRMKQVLDKYELDMNQFLSFLNSNTSCILHPSTPEGEAYVPRNTAPVNPPRLTLDYTKSTTDEGKLRAAVLEHCERRVVALVAYGKGGVGKTCAMRGLQDDDHIERRFPGGTLYIQLGSESTRADIIRALATIVQRTGGRMLAEQMQSTKSLREASESASDWFHNQTCLFLVDDIWKVNDIDGDVFDILGSMVSRSSRLVYTTRDKRLLGRAHKVIYFEDKDTFGELATRMLTKHAGFDEIDELQQRNRIAFEAILRECQGNPLAIGIAGGAVLRKSARKVAARKEDAWYDFYDDITSNPHKSMLLESYAEQYGSLNRIVDASLRVLDMNSQRESYDNFFQALCVLQKQQFIPLELLQKLWNLESMQETERVAEVLHQVSVLQLNEENGRISVQLHDMILDIAVDKASTEFKVQSFFRALIHNYSRSGVAEGISPTAELLSQECVAENAGRRSTKTASQLRSDSNGYSRAMNGIKSNQEREQKTLRKAWWKTKDDGYLHDNLCRILRCAGYKDDLLWLLSNPEWIAHRLQSAGSYKVEQDLEEGKSVISGSGLPHNDLREHLEMVGKAARLSSTYVINNAREVWFQLHGRLLWHAIQSQRTKEFVDIIEQCAQRPWVKASGARLLQQASQSALGIVRSNGEILCASAEQDELWFFWEDYGERIGVTRYNLVSGSSRSVDLVVEEPIQVDNKIPEVLCAAIFRDEQKVVGVFVTGIVVEWSRVTGMIERVIECRSGGLGRELRQSLHWGRNLMRCFGSRVLGEEQSSSAVPFHKIWICAAVSGDGHRIVCGSEDGTIRVWDSQSGKPVAKPLLGHTDAVGCVAVSDDGRRIVSGSDDRTVRVWDALSGETVFGALRGHTDFVSCVKLSPDGSLIISGSLDGTIRMWNAKNGRAVRDPLRSPSDWVRCVTVSADGKLIVSGSAYGSVDVWDVRSSEAIGWSFRGHTDWVRCVTFNVDGSHIVSGSRDRTVRLWDAWTCSNVIEYEPNRSDFDLVSCATMSADRKWIVSGSDTGIVQVWDALSGEAAGTPLRHNSEIDRVGVDTQCTRIVSEGLNGFGKLWDAHSGDCLLTSADASWEFVVETYDLSWSSSETELDENNRQVVVMDKDRTKVVLATCEEEVRNFGGGARYWPKNMQASCEIIH